MCPLVGVGRPGLEDGGRGSLRLAARENWLSTRPISQRPRLRPPRLRPPRLPLRSRLGQRVEGGPLAGGEEPQQMSRRRHCPPLGGTAKNRPLRYAVDPDTPLSPEEFAPRPRP